MPTSGAREAGGPQAPEVEAGTQRCARNWRRSAGSDTRQPVHAGTVREGRRWIVEDFDLASSLRYRAERTLTLGAWRRSLRGVEEAAYFAPDDLRALLAMCAGRVRKLVRSVSQAAARRRRIGGPTLRPGDRGLVAPTLGRVQDKPIMCNERLAPELDPSAG